MQNIFNLVKIYHQLSFIENTCIKRSEFKTQRAKYKEQHLPSKSSNSMVAIVTKDQAIPKSIADAACSSLDEEINRKREEGALEAGKISFVKLEWTLETQEAVRAFEVSPDLAQIQSLGGNPQGRIRFAGPIVFSDVVPNEPLWYPSLALGLGIIGIIALGTVVLPEIAHSARTTIESGSVAYFRDSSPIVYHECKGRGIMFSISK